MEYYDFAAERKFTEVYQRMEHQNTALREIACLEQMYPAAFQPIRPGDVFAGRIRMSLVGFSPEPGGLGYYCDSDAIRKLLEDKNYPQPLRQQAEQLLLFWENRQTKVQVRAAYPPEVAQALPSDRWESDPLAAAPLYRMAGSYLDYEKLLTKGIVGLQQEIQNRKEHAAKAAEDTVLFDCMQRALRLLAVCCMKYSREARELSAASDNEREHSELTAMADALEAVAHRAPASLREAMQLMWIYALISGTYNYGRLDMVFGDFLERDLRCGSLTEAQAQHLFNGLWQLMADRNTIWNGRVVLGGRGRKNEANADRAALLAMEATRVVREGEPQLSLRVYEGMDARLLNKAIQVIGEGRTDPLLYNDDVNIPAVSKAFGVGMQEAETYLPFGCGEYVLDHKSYGSPNGVINLLKVLELVLHNGRDAVTGEQAGLRTGDVGGFERFEQLWDAYTRQTEYFVQALAQQEKIEYEVTAQTAPFVFLSMLYDDCIARGKSIFDGGIQYLGGTLETYGNINTADSLTAIKQLCYDSKVLSLGQLVEALDANFVGYPQIRKLVLSAPKYGNDDPIADSMAQQVHRHICTAVRRQAASVGLHSYLVVIINNSANTTMGKLTAASADGRQKGMHMANANNPWGGNDTKGLTAMLNSLVKLDPDLHAGAVQNMKFSPELFREDGALVRSILKAYFAKGGTQAMISVLNRGDLEQAMLHPEQYGHIFVRVGGFSARFVELEKAVQREILSRTLY